MLGRLSKRFLVALSNTPRKPVIYEEVLFDSNSEYNT
jgi:hypothetical protein